MTTVLEPTRLDVAEQTGEAQRPLHHQLDHRITGGASAIIHTKVNARSNPIAHLSPAQIEQLGVELDALRASAMGQLGEADAAYIRRLIAAQRALEIGSRLVLVLGWRSKVGWAIGTLGLGVSKILDNMEIGHNVMHGQWDWMRDPKVHSSTWDWNTVSPAKQWKHAHNQIHHTYTNVIGRDNDLGYGIMRVSPAQTWHPIYLAQPLLNVANALLFEYSIAAYDLELAKNWKSRNSDPEWQARASEVVAKIKRLALRDYVLWPALAGPGFVSNLGANVTANLIRNVWTHAVIMCGHFPAGAQTFTYHSIDDETRGEWYLRQLLGSANISGSRALHLMTGYLSHQVEHHLYPDMPSIALARVSPQVRQIQERYGIPVVTGSLIQQVSSAWAQIIKLSLPNDTSLGQSVGILARSGIRGLRERAKRTKFSLG